MNRQALPQTDLGCLKTKQKAKTRANTKCSDERRNAQSLRSRARQGYPISSLHANTVAEITANAVRNEGKASRLKRHKTLFADRTVDVEKPRNSTNKQ